jgi:hypothetical protein
VNSSVGPWLQLAIKDPKSVSYDKHGNGWCITSLGDPPDAFLAALPTDTREHPRLPMAVTSETQESESPQKHQESPAPIEPAVPSKQDHSSVPVTQQVEDTDEDMDSGSKETSSQLVEWQSPLEHSLPWFVGLCSGGQVSSR